MRKCFPFISITRPLGAYGSYRKPRTAPRAIFRGKYDLVHFSAASCALWGLFIYNIYNTPRRLNFVNKSPESTRMTAEKAHYTPQIDGENDAPPHPVAEAPSRPPPPESTCPATSRSVTKSVLLFVAGVVLKAAPCELFLMSSSLCIVSDVVLALHAPLRGPHAPGSACTSLVYLLLVFRVCSS